MEYKNDLYHHYRFRFDILSHIYLQHKCTTQKELDTFIQKEVTILKEDPQ